MDLLAARGQLQQKHLHHCRLTDKGWSHLLRLVSAIFQPITNIQVKIYYIQRNRRISPQHTVLQDNVFSGLYHSRNGIEPAAVAGTIQVDAPSNYLRV
jgi:hypothetical protein